MMMLMHRHTKDGYGSAFSLKKNGYGSAFSLKTRQIDLTNYVCWIPQVWHGSIMLMVHNTQEKITTSESVRVCLCIYMCIHMCIYVYTHKCIFMHVYYIYVHIYVYV